MVDARKARYRLYDILDVFHFAIDNIIYSEMDVNDKIADIKELGDQLASEVKELSEIMSHEVMVTLKSLNLND